MENNLDSGFENQLKGAWNQLKGKVQQQWAELTEDDLAYVEGKGVELLGRIQEKTGETQQDIKEFFNGLFEKRDNEDSDTSDDSNNSQMY